MNDLDPVTLQIIWNNLRSIADECFVSLMRSAFSTNIKERHDHSTAVTDARGRLIAQAELALPIHIASMTGLMQALLERYGDDIGEGDLFVANDPHVAGGTHLPDINMA
ncbi:MAG: hydantoinase B/oxoprolinase family protein, partial [Aestuariivirgaceae bacterium]